MKQAAKSSAKKRGGRCGRVDEVRGCKTVFLQVVKLLKSCNKRSERCPPESSGHRCRYRFGIVRMTSVTVGRV